MGNAQHLALATYAFAKSPSGAPDAFDRLLEFSTVYDERHDDQVTSMAVDSHFQVYLGGTQVPMSGIGYVASYPEYRGDGAIRRIMTRILRDNYDKGTVLSYLAPFSYQFYAKFGYGYAFNQKLYRVPMTAFPKGDRGQLKVQRESSFEPLMPIFEQAHNQGTIARTPQQWSYYFKTKKLNLHFATFGQEGYLIYHWTPASEFVIDELIANTDDAKQAIYYFVASHGSFETVVWTAPGSVTLEQDMAEPAYADIRLKPYMQARIVNVAEFLTHYPIDFAVTISDDLIPENNGTYGPFDQEPIQMTISEFSSHVFLNGQFILRDYF
jgi:predicted acetyltransferase